MRIVNTPQPGGKTPFPAFRPEGPAARTTLPAQAAGEAPATGRPGAKVVKAAPTAAATATSTTAPGAPPGRTVRHITRTDTSHVADNTPHTALPGRKLPPCR
ncbi:hypothetical protein GCM10027162_43860 [Streptomyces incanus]